MASLNLTRFSDEGPNQVGQFVIKEWVEMAQGEEKEEKSNREKKMRNDLC